MSPTLVVVLVVVSCLVASAMSSMRQSHPWNENPQANDIDQLMMPNGDVNLGSVDTKAAVSNEQLMMALKQMMKKQRDEQLRRCLGVLPAAICRKSSPQPFYLWAQVAAHDLTRDPLQQLRMQLLKQLDQANHV